MKVKAQQRIIEFKPVDITITFETQKEIDFFYAIFNHTDILGSLNNSIDGRIIRAKLIQHTVDADAAFQHLKESLNDQSDTEWEDK